MRLGNFETSFTRVFDHNDQRPRDLKRQPSKCSCWSAGCRSPSRSTQLPCWDLKICIRYVSQGRWTMTDWGSYVLTSRQSCGFAHWQVPVWWRGALVSRSTVAKRSERRPEWYRSSNNGGRAGRTSESSPLARGGGKDWYLGSVVLAQSVQLASSSSSWREL